MYTPYLATEQLRLLVANQLLNSINQPSACPRVPAPHQCNQTSTFSAVLQPIVFYAINELMTPPSTRI